MTNLEIILGLLVLSLILAGLWWMVRLARRASLAEAGLARANEALSRWAAILAEPLGQETPNLDLARRVADLCLQEFGAAGALLLGPVDYDRHPYDIPIWGAAGTCRQWGTEVEEDETHDEASPRSPLLQLDHDLPHHFFWSAAPLSYHGERLRQWLPAAEADEFSGLLAAPVELPDDRRGLLLVLRGAGDPAFGRMDTSLLAVVVQLAEARFRLVRLKLRLTELEAAVQRAHEEGMLQIASGIIHNLGNAVTVVQVELERLSNLGIEQTRMLTGFQANELLPLLVEQAAGKGSVEPALVESLQRVAAQLDRTVQELAGEAQAVLRKFEEIMEVIALQQRFIGELGTESVVPVATIVSGVQKTVAPSLAQRELTMTVACDTTARVLVDPAMMLHILVLLIKYAVDSTMSAQRADGELRLNAFDEQREGRDWVVIEVVDSGFSAPFDLDQPERIPVRAGMEQRLRDYLFCRQRLAKYGGHFAIAARLDRGTTVRLELPRHGGRDDDRPVIRT